MNSTSDLNSTENCRKVLQERFNLNAANWKRGRKFKQSNKTFRQFIHEKANKEVTVIFDPAEHEDEVFFIVDRLVEPHLNKDTFPEIFGEDCSGRVYFSINAEWKNEITFNCGAETKDGGMHDSQSDDGIIELLGRLFQDCNLEFAISENLHLITPKGQTMRELRGILVNRIMAAGAVFYDDENLRMSNGQIKEARPPRPESRAIYERYFAK
jgi:hypothetical protein